MSHTANVIVLGGGMIGLSTAMLLARQGHHVTVFERDGDPLPTSPVDAWEAWERRGVVQFRQPHYLQSAGRLLLDQYLPDVCQALVRSGGVRFDMLQLMPPTIADRAPRIGDERFVTVTGRRAVMEYAAASAAQECGVDVVRGATVSGPLSSTACAGAIPHVTGIRTETGGEFHADLVIDATGRRSRLPELLATVGARAPYEQSEESGFILAAAVTG